MILCMPAMCGVRRAVFLRTNFCSGDAGSQDRFPHRSGNGKDVWINDVTLAEWLGFFVLGQKTNNTNSA